MCGRAGCGALWAGNRQAAQAPTKRCGQRGQRENSPALGWKHGNGPPPGGAGGGPQSGAACGDGHTSQQSVVGQDSCVRRSKPGNGDGPPP